MQALLTVKDVHLCLSATETLLLPSVNECLAYSNIICESRSHHYGKFAISRRDSEIEGYIACLNLGTNCVQFACACIPPIT